MTTFARRAGLVGSVLLIGVAAGCSRDESPPGRTAPGPLRTATAVAGQQRFDIAAGSSATFLIDAPLEKIKGRATKVRGTIVVNPDNLRASTGHVEVDLDDLRTETFDDAEKNKAQTEHARNWFEIGPDVEAKLREQNRRALFTIKAIDEANPVRLASAEATDGGRSSSLRATGDLWIHGASAPKTVQLAVTFIGPPQAPTSLHIATSEPLKVSLKEHDVKPRDLAGKFLSGALEKIGQKIEDTVQVSLDLTAKAP